MSDNPATSRTLHPARVAGRSIAASLMRAAQKALVERGDGCATGRAIAQRWGVTHAVVDRMGDPTAGVAIALGDVLALPRELARQILAGALAALDDGTDVPTRDSLDRVAIELGAAVARLHQDLADGCEDEHGVHATALRRIAAIALRGAASCDRRAAR